ncbi:hypothetical protein, partial [Streptomyces sp. NPDC046759]|uniref:hypothetical protein n=1 Tax=Streptomyces sp. NPDC046759 TaxID=3155019 RepID=UPI0034062971
MAGDRLPYGVREFASYLDGLLARLDQGGGWSGVFWRRDPDGMRACLDGHEVPPWDVVEALLEDLAAAYGPAAADAERERARALHRAALTAYDARPGARDALADRLDVMLREQRHAAERQAELTRLLSTPAIEENTAALRLDLAWSRDDHERATARCAELLSRLAELDRRGAPAPVWGDDGSRSVGEGPGRAGAGVPPRVQDDDRDDVRRPPGSAGGRAAHGDPAGRPTAGPERRRAGWGRDGGHLVTAATPSPSRSPEATAHAYGAAGDAPGAARAQAVDTGAPARVPHAAPGPASHAAPPHSTPPAPDTVTPTRGDTPPAPPDRAPAPPHPSSSAAPTPPAFGQGAAVREDPRPAPPARGAVPPHPSSWTAPATPSPGQVVAAPEGSRPSPPAPDVAAPHPPPAVAGSEGTPPGAPAKSRKRRRGGARFAGMSEDAAPPAVVPQDALQAALPGRRSGGARFAGMSEDAAPPAVVPQDALQAALPGRR